MSDKPIIFNGEMVQALLDGRKTQTRRVLKGVGRDNCLAIKRPASLKHLRTHAIDTPEHPHLLPISVSIGDRLWVRENCFIAPQGWTDSPINPCGPYNQEVGYSANEGTIEAAQDYNIKQTPSIHMNRWASRITLTVTDVRVQWAQDISEADARDEGANHATAVTFLSADELAVLASAEILAPHAVHRIIFEELWNSINEKRGYGWDTNPWVAAYTFTVHKSNIDQMESAQ